VTPEEVSTDTITTPVPTYDVVTVAPWFKEGIDYGRPAITDTVSTVQDTPKVEVAEIEETTVKEKVEPADEEITTNEDIVAVDKPVDIVNEQTPVTTPTTEIVQTPVEQTPTPVVSTPTTPRSTYNTGLAPEAFASTKGRLPWPVSGGRITDSFGTRKNAEVRGLSPNNFGIDMLCPAGATIKATHGGTILLARRQSPYDVIVTVKHGDYTTAYYYLIKSYVKQGDIVQAGQALGQLRTSVEEADFHFEIWHNQERLNPEVWLK